jgi:hypothetical protein
MPRLILFAPCEKVIIEQGSGGASLISLLQELKASAKELPKPGQTVANQWNVVAIWRKLGTDTVQEFEQRVTLEDPGGINAFDLRTQFQMTKDYHRTFGNIAGFPIGVEGEYTLRLFVREVGAERWDERANYPIHVVHKLESASA